MSSDVFPAVVGAAAGIITSFGASFFTRRRTAAETRKALEEAALASATAEKLRAETREIEARVTAGKQEAEDLKLRVSNTEAEIAYERAAPRTTTVFSSTAEGFSLFDFEVANYDDARSELRVETDLARDDTLVVLRQNESGRAFVWLKRYGYAGNPDAVPVGESAGAQRNFRLQCKVRTTGANRTVLFNVKQLGAPPGEMLGSRRLRLESDAWTDVDASFTVAPTAAVRVRIEDRSVSAAPSRLEVRELLITERGAPAELLA